MRKRILLLLIAAALLIGCSDVSVRPVIGGWKLSDGSAAVAFKSDDTFIYSESVEGTYECVLEGTYSVSLEQFDFKSARGTLTLRVPEGSIPTVDVNGTEVELYSGLILSEGTNTIDFYWYASDVPVMTWIFDENDSSKNYTFHLAGEEDYLDGRVSE